jgi:hypothetical protein
VPDLDAVPPVISQQKEKKVDKKEKGMNMNHKTKIKKALMKMNILPRNGNRYVILVMTLIKMGGRGGHGMLLPMDCNT